MRFLKSLVLLLVLSLAWACGSSPKSAVANPNNNGGDSNATTSDPNYTGPTLKFHGRLNVTNANTALLTWAGSGVSARVTNTQTLTGKFTLTGTSDPNDYAFLDVVINGNFSSTPLIIDNTNTTYTIFSGLNASNIYAVDIYKRTESSYSKVAFGGLSIDTGGEFLNTATPSGILFQFIGDSITNGYGTLGDITYDVNGAALSACTLSGGTIPSYYEDSSDSYASLVATAFGAEAQLIAYSGKGVYLNNDNTNTNTMPEEWVQSYPDSGIKFNFTNSQEPNVVFINLGTNDAASGNVNTFAPAAFEAAYLAFLTTIRNTYPNATIIATIGPMLTTSQTASMNTYIQAALAQFADDNTYFTALQPQNLVSATGGGCQYHPGPAEHEAMAEALITYIDGLSLSGINQVTASPTAPTTALTLP